MKKRICLFLAFCCWTGAISAHATANADGKSSKNSISHEDRPNIVFIVVDQWRKAAGGYWSKEPYKSAIHDQGDPVVTPNIDRFADQGLVFTHAISPFPLCSPYRGMMLSGKLPSRNGVVLNCNCERPVSQLRGNVVCISDVLKKAGYSLGYIGKLHTDYPTPNINGLYAPASLQDGKVWDAYTPPGPRRHGFDYWYAYGTWDEHFDPHYWDTEGNLHEPKVWSPDEDAKMAVSYILNDHSQRKSGRPFGLWVSINPPHPPYDECKEADRAVYKGLSWKDLAVRLDVDPSNKVMRTEIKNYFAMVHGVDKSIGRILDAIDQVGLADNTIVVLTADHGEQMGSHNLMSKNDPYAEALDVPFLLRYPAKLKPHTDDLLLSSCDIMPTLLGLAGLESDIPKDLDGSNYANLLLGRPSAVKRPNVEFFFRNINGPVGKDGKVHDFVTDFIGARTYQYTIWISRKNSKWPEVGLFDNIKDPYELHNLVDSDPVLLEKMLKKLKSAIPPRFPVDKLHPEVAVRLNAIK